MINYTVGFLDKYLIFLNDLLCQTINYKKLDKLEKAMINYQDVLMFMPSLNNQLQHDDFVYQVDEKGELLLDVDSLESGLKKVRSILNILNNKGASNQFIVNLLDGVMLQEFQIDVESAVNRITSIPMYWPEWCFIDRHANFIMPWEYYQDGYFFHQKSEKCFMLLSHLIQFDSIPLYIDDLKKIYGISWDVASSFDIDALKLAVYKPDELSCDKYVWIKTSMSTDSLCFSKNLKNYQIKQTSKQHRNFLLLTGFHQ